MADEYLGAHVPRNLRVRASMQIANTRLPARSFILAMVVLLAGGIAVARGADLLGTAETLGPLLGAGVLVLEGRWWGYSTTEFTRIVLTHLSRPRKLAVEQREIALAVETSIATVRRPRWHAEEGAKA